MIIIPAVDIKNGKCVRLRQGRMDQETIYSDHPAEMAAKWEELGAQLIHLVDLDGAVQKHPVNLKTIQQIKERVRCPIQIGGGIRNLETIDMYFDLGADRIIIGSEAIKNPDLVYQAADKYPNRVVVGIDAKNGYVAIEGWTQTTDALAVETAKRFSDTPLAAFHFTDIHRDGMRTGPNIEETKRFAEVVGIPVIASGGVSGLQDIHNLLPLKSVGVVGVIIGRALYTGDLDLTEAIKIVKK